MEHSRAPNARGVRWEETWPQETGRGEHGWGGGTHPCEREPRDPKPRGEDASPPPWSAGGTSGAKARPAWKQTVLLGLLGAGAFGEEGKQGRVKTESVDVQILKCPTLKSPNLL